jgi:hypothetical protein
LLAGENKKTARDSLLIWLLPIGAITVTPIDQNKVTVLRIEVDKG